MQKKNPLYSLLKEETVWSMERFNTYINETYMLSKGLPKDWALGPFAVSLIFYTHQRGTILKIFLKIYIISDNQKDELRMSVNLI